MITGTYLGSKKTHEFECKEGHRFHNSPSNIIRHNQWCPICSGLAPKTIGDMRQYAESKGGKCRSKTYVNNRIKLTWECAKGHVFKATWGNVQQGKWCPVCAGRPNYTIDDILKKLKDKDIELLSGEYINEKSRFKLRCKEGHEWETSGAVIMRGSGCKLCASREAGIRNRKWTIEDMRKTARDRGGECLSSEYRGFNEKYLWKCDNGHTWEAKYSQIKAGSWCPYCKSSLGERICRVFFEKMFLAKFKKVHPTWLRGSNGRPLELDGYCEGLGLAFEYNDHKTELPFSRHDTNKLEKTKQNDQLKVKLCRKNKVKLFIIPLQRDMKCLMENIKSIVKKQCNASDIGILPDDYDVRVIDYNSAYISEDKTIMEELRSIAKKSGFVILDNDYLGINYKLLCRCEKGHKFSISPAKLKAGQGCRKCGRQKVADKLKNTLMKIQKLAESRNAICLSTEFVNMHTPMRFQCKLCGRIFEKTPMFMYRGFCCSNCRT